MEHCVVSNSCELLLHNQWDQEQTERTKHTYVYVRAVSVMIEH